MNRRLICLLAGLLAMLHLSSCHSLQDIGMAQVQAEQGELAAAEAMLQALMEDGYTEAQLALADLYAKSGTPADMQRAGTLYQETLGRTPLAEYRYARWLERMSYLDRRYREAAANALAAQAVIRPDVLPVLARFYAAHDEHYPGEFLERFIDQGVSNRAQNDEIKLGLINYAPHPDRYRKSTKELCNEVAGDEKSSLCYQIRCKTVKLSGDTEALQSFIEELSTSLGARGNDGEQAISATTEDTLYRCSRILLSQDFGGSQVLAGLRVAALGIPMSDRLFLLSARYEYKQQILMSDEVLLSNLTRLAVIGDPDAARLLGRMYGEGRRVADDPGRAEYYLLKAGSDPRAALSLGRLYLSGKCGEDKLQTGVEKLLFAGRHGLPRAYYFLARAFVDNPGIVPNPTYSWVFAQLAQSRLTQTHHQDQLRRVTDDIIREQIDYPSAQQLLRHEQSMLTQFKPSAEES